MRVFSQINKYQQKTKQNKKDGRSATQILAIQKFS